MPPIEVVITGLGVVCPIGIGRKCVWQALCEGQSGIRAVTLLDPAALPAKIAGEVRGFDPKAQGMPRKSLKVMARDSQFGVAASLLARQDAQIAAGAVDPERMGVLLGADRINSDMEYSEGPYRKCVANGRFDFGRWPTDGFAATFPLSFLRVLPNMIASHVSIVLDARGPSNTIHNAEVSSLQAIIEAAHVIQRGMADVMIAGGASSQMTPFDWVRHGAYGHLSPQSDPPAAILRPFDADRSGDVLGEGAATFVLESRAHAEARGATILARIAGWANTSEPAIDRPVQGDAIARALGLAVQCSGLSPKAIGHVNAHGSSTPAADAIEARAIHSVLSDTPVTAPRSNCGNLGAATGAVEMVASLLAISEGLVPPTLNYALPDPACPVRVVAKEPLQGTPRSAVLLNWTDAGQAVALVLAAA